MTAEPLTCCRVCSGPDLHPLPGWGPAPARVHPAVAPDEPAGEPVGRVLCTGCGAVQIDRIVPPLTLYRNAFDLDRHLSDRGQACAELAAHLVGRLGLGPSNLVLDIGSNDGTLLREFRNRGMRILGVEAGPLRAAQAQRDGIGGIHGQYGPLLGGYVARRFGPARLVVARLTLGLYPDVPAFLRAVAGILTPNGFAVLQVRHVRAVYDDLAGEMVHPASPCAFTLRGLANLAPTCGLTLVDAESGPANSASAFLTFRPAELARGLSPGLRLLLTREDAGRFRRPATWEEFATRWRAACGWVRGDLARLAQFGTRAVGFAATPDGLSFLHAVGAAPGHVDAVVDPNPAAHGMWVPGSSVPVVPTAEADRPGAVLLLDRTLLSDGVQWAGRRPKVRLLAPFPQPVSTAAAA